MQPQQNAAIDPRWVHTLQQASDPGLTVHERPAANARDVEALAQTLAQSGLAAQAEEAGKASATSLEKGATGATVADNGADGADGAGDVTLPEASLSVMKTIASFARKPSDAARGAAPALPVLPALSAASLSGEGVIGRDAFSFEGVLGRGGMGTVYNARQAGMARGVAVKMMLREQLGDAAAVAAFMREALTTGALAHPNIIPVYFFGRDEQGRPFMVMKRVQGRPWNELLAEDGAERSKEFDLRRHLKIFASVCDAVAFAHARQIVHRDLKPANVMVGDFGEVTVMDWGLALDVSPEPGRMLALRREDAALVAGTPAYMAPEMVRCDAANLSERTDIYLLGAILHELLNGRPPHRGKTVLEVLQRALQGLGGERIAPRPNLPRECRELERMIHKAMAQSPGERYASVRELAADIANFLTGQGDREESEALAQSARDELAKLANETEDLLNTSPFYPRCTEILAHTQQALALWGFNPRAVRVRQETQALFADLALRGKDWGLAESVLRDLRLSGSGGHALAAPLEQRLRVLRDKDRDRGFLVRRAARLALCLALLLAALSSYLYWKLWEARVDLAQERAGIFKPVLPEEREEAAAHSDFIRGNPPPGGGVSGARDVSAHPAGALPAEIETRPFNPDGPVIELGSAQKPEAIFAPASGDKLTEAQPVWNLPGNTVVSAIAFSPEGLALLLDEKGDAWLWFGSGGARKVTPPASQGVLRCAWAGGRMAVVAGKDGALYSCQMPATERGLLQPWAQAVKMEQDAGRLEALALAGGGGQPLRIATASGSALRRQNGANQTPDVREAGEKILALRYLPAGPLLAATQHGLRAFFPDDHMLKLGLGEDFSQAVCADGAACALLVPVQRPWELQIVRLNIATGNAASSKVATAGHEPLACFAIAGDGKLVASATRKGELAILLNSGAIRGRVLARTVLRDCVLAALAFSPDGKRLFGADRNGGIHVWKVDGLE